MPTSEFLLGVIFVQWIVIVAFFLMLVSTDGGKLRVHTPSSSAPPPPPEWSVTYRMGRATHVYGVPGSGTFTEQQALAYFVKHVGVGYQSIDRIERRAVHGQSSTHSSQSHHQGHGGR